MGEKPFAGINGSGKHCNWSIGTDTGINFFYPGKTEEARTIYTAALACLSHGIMQHNEMLRCSVAHAGNDHRLGAQEAPPAIISLYPGTGFEAHVDNVIKGGSLSVFKAEKKKQKTGCKAAMDVEANVETATAQHLSPSAVTVTSSVLLALHRTALSRS